MDQIYNLACPASPVHYQYNPVKTVKSNVMGTLNMLVLAKRVRARILQASTSEVYGDPTVHPQTESYWGNVNPIGPRACYDEGKRVAETLMSDYHREDGVDIRIARIFNTYGPRMAENDGRVVSNFIVQALRGQELTLYGTGEQTRSFCYVDDLVDGLVRLMNARRGPARAGQPRQPGRVHHPGAGRGGREGRGRRGARGVPAAAPGRPDPAAAGHHPRPRVAGLGAEDAARRRAGEDGGLLPGAGSCAPAGPRPGSQPPPLQRVSFDGSLLANGEPGTSMNCRRRRSVLLGAALAVGLACARNPVTGKNELALVSEGQEIEMGKQAAQEVPSRSGS